jgi:outer membrane scaffolding protein for murein synthesis (MipA/OmpV family)
VKYAVSFLAAGMLLSLPAAHAASGVDVQPIPDLPLRNVPPVGEPAAPPPEWKVTLGGGASYAPRYEGSANDRLRFMPLLEATRGHLFISPLRGLGYNFSDDRNLEYGVRLTPGHARWQNADPRLNGMGDIGYSIEAGAFATVRFAPWYVSSGLTTGIHGTHAELGGGIGLPLSKADRLRLGINLNWGSTRYNQTYFGISPAQAAASGLVLTPYTAGAGVKDYALTANWAHNFDQQWFSSTGASIKWLTGSARNSPLTQRGTQRSINFVVGYRF